MSGPVANGRNLPPLTMPTPNQNNDQEGEGPKKRKKKNKEDREGEPASPRRPSSKKSPANNADSEQAETDENTTSRRKPRKPKAPRETDGSATEEGPTMAKPKRKKKSARGSKEELVGDDTGTLSTTKKKRKKKAKVSASGENNSGYEDEFGGELAGVVSLVKDDIVQPDGEEEEVDPSEAHIGAPKMRSEPISRVYIENKDGFKSKDRYKLAKKLADEQARVMEYDPVITKETTIQFALLTHRIFHKFTLFCHGLLGGIALWQVVTIYSLSSGSNTFETMLELYHPAALPVQSMYYILFALCTVSVFDRYDVGRFDKKTFIQAVTLQSGAIAVLIYFAIMVISVTMAATDDKINHYGGNTTLWGDPEIRDSELGTWRILNLVRGIGALLGWFIVSITPTADRLSENLEKADENIIGDLQDPNEPLRSSGV